MSAVDRGQLVAGRKRQQEHAGHARHPPSVAKLIAKHGRKGNMMKWREQLNGDCPKCDARMQDRCDLVCPDLPKVL